MSVHFIPEGDMFDDQQFSSGHIDLNAMEISI
jgi:hypothetical protein